MLQSLALGGLGYGVGGFKSCESGCIRVKGEWKLEDPPGSMILTSDLCLKQLNLSLSQLIRHALQYF
jgi:hypothetical protein